MESKVKTKRNERKNETKRNERKRTKSNNLFIKSIFREWEDWGKAQNWPYWHAGVLTMYATELAMNHVAG